MEWGCHRRGSSIHESISMMSWEHEGRLPATSLQCYPGSALSRARGAKQSKMLHQPIARHPRQCSLSRGFRDDEGDEAMKWKRWRRWILMSDSLESSLHRLSISCAALYPWEMFESHTDYCFWGSFKRSPRITPLKTINSVQTRGIVKTSGLTRGVCKTCRPYRNMCALTCHGQWGIPKRFSFHTWKDKNEALA